MFGGLSVKSLSSFTFGGFVVLGSLWHLSVAAPSVLLGSVMKVHSIGQLQLVIH